MAVFTNELKLDTSQFANALKTVQATAKGSADNVRKAFDMIKPKVDVKVDDSQVKTTSKEIDGLSRTEHVKIDVDTEQAKSSFSGLNSFIGGAIGGLAVGAIGSLATGLKEGALRADEFGDSLAVAFKQQGIADVDGEIKRVNDSAVQLANNLGLPSERTKQLAVNVATLGNVSGQQAADLTKLSAGIEVFTNGAVQGEAVVKAFTRGIADPEGAKAIENLTKKYPALAETLRSNLGPAEKLAQANLALGSSFAEVEAQQTDAGGTLNKISNQVNEAFEQIGTQILEALAPLATALVPITEGLIASFQTLGPIIAGVVDNFDIIGPAILTAAAAYAAYTIAVTAGTTATTIVTKVTAAWNAVLAANPVGLVAAAVVVATAAVIALSDALSISAEEALENSEAEKKLVEQQIQSNKERKVSVTQTKSLADEFTRLAQKTERTAAEEKRLREVQGQLDKQYPDLIDQTKSFSDNLAGVAEIGKRTTAELGQLDKQSQELAGRLEKATRAIAFAARNAAISELQDLTDRTIGVFGSAELEKAGQDFANAIYNAKTAEQAQAAFTSFSETVNGLGLNATKLNEVYGKANGVLSKTLATFKSGTSDVDAASAAIKTNTQAETDNTDAKEKKVKKTKEEASAYEKAQQAYKAFLDTQRQGRLEEEARLKRGLLSGELTQGDVKLQLAQFDKTQLQARLAEAKKIFGVVQQSEGGLALDTSIKPASDETKKEILDETNRIILETNDKILDIEIGLIPKPEKKGNIVTALKKLLSPEEFNRQLLAAGVVFGIPITIGKIEPPKQSLADQILGDLGRNAADAVTKINWREVFKKPEQASKESIDEIGKNLADGTLTYQDAVKKLNESVGELPTVFDLVVQQLNASFTELTNKQIASLATVADSYQQGKATSAEFYNALAQTAGAAFAQILTEQEDYGKATLSIALDTLEALIPVLVAQITGINLANPATPLGTGLIVAAALSATLYGLVAAAKASVSGFAEGGYTGNGGKYEPAGIVHRGEFVVNANNTRKYRGVLEAMNNGTFSPVVTASSDALVTTGQFNAMHAELAAIRQRLDSMPNGIYGKQSVSLDVGFDSYLYQRDQRRSLARRMH
jgi:lambda family phage tail tape measure protein